MGAKGYIFLLHLDKLHDSFKKSHQRKTKRTGGSRDETLVDIKWIFLTVSLEKDG